MADDVAFSIPPPSYANVEGNMNIPSTSTQGPVFDANLNTLDEPIKTTVVSDKFIDKLNDQSINQSTALRIFVILSNSLD